MPMAMAMSVRRVACSACAAVLLWVVPARSADAPVWVVMAPAAGPQSLTREEVAQLYRKQKTSVSGMRIQPVNLPAQHALRRWFMLQLLAQSPEEMDAYWRDQYFNGVLPPFVLASEEAVARFVLATPGALGYVSSCNADKRLRVVLILEGGPACGR